MKRFNLDGLGLVPQGDSGPKWNKLFPLNTTRYRPDFPKGGITFDSAFFETLLGNWARAGKPALPCDYFHRGETGDELPRAEKVAAGWIEDLQLRPDGLYGLFDWTDEARQRIGADQLRYLSPTFGLNTLDTATGKPQGPQLFGAALLNDPFLQDLPRVAASNRAQGPTKEQQMDFMKQLAKHLGLADDANSDAVMAAVQGLMTKCSDFEKKAAAPPPPPPPAPHAEPDADDKAKAVGLARAEVLSLTQKLEATDAERTKLAARVAGLEEERAEAERTALVDELVRERRIAPAGKDSVIKFAKAMGIKEARTFFTSQPKLVVLEGEKGVAGDINANPDTARKQLITFADELKAKHNLTIRDAMERAAAEHPDVAQVAFSTTHN